MRFSKRRCVNTFTDVRTYIVPIDKAVVNVIWKKKRCDLFNLKHDFSSLRKEKLKNRGKRE